MLSHDPGFGQDRLNDFDAVLPQVARGGDELRFETKIILINPHADTAVAELTATTEGLVEAPAVELGPFERREIVASGGELTAGALRIRSEHFLDVSAVISARDSTSGELISRVSVPAQPLSNSVVIPVLHNADDIESTGIAVFFRELGFYSGRLFDESGRQVAQTTIFRQVASAPRQRTWFVDELFPNADFSQGFRGWIHFFGSSLQARGVAAVALYSHGAHFLSSQATPMDTEAAYILTLKDEDDDELRQELAAQYGFGFRSPRLIQCRDTVAVAVERDPRVESVMLGWVPLNISGGSPQPSAMGDRRD